MSKVPRISRRTMLRGAGVAIALPALECMTPVVTFVVIYSVWNIFKPVDHITVADPRVILS